MKDPQLRARFESVGKKYCRTLRQSMLYNLHDIGRDLLARKPSVPVLRPGEFWALDDVSFEVRSGECLGIIGPNGAGKSTLLKLLNGIMLPDRGRVTTRGRLGALIEIGAGFHPMLTGRENIYVNGAILGLRRMEISQRLDEIIAFAELEEFIDAPVKHYSSGMHVRLGFSIAAHMQPDLLLIDEALSVGDFRFSVKCYNHIGNLLQTGTAALFASHQLNQVQILCNSCVVLANGNVALAGTAAECVDHYLASATAPTGQPLSRVGSTPSIIQSVALNGKCLEAVHAADPGDPFVMKVTLDTRGLSVHDAQFEVRFWRDDQIIQTVTTDSSRDWSPTLTGQRTLTLSIPELLFAPGPYQLAFGLVSTARNNYIDWYPRSTAISIKGVSRWPGAVQLPCELDIDYPDSADCAVNH